MNRIWMYCALGLLAATACAPTAAPARRSRPGDDTRALLDREVPRLLAEAGVPSVSIAHIEDGRITLAVAYGSRSPGLPATPQTLYNIASMTKPISAEVILRLASKGELSLDEPMSPYWVDPDIARDERHKLLTPRLALSHQTGFPNWRYETGGVLTFQRGPGEAAGYSGEGYEYVARFAEKKMGKGFEELARTLLFEPVGMGDTAYTGRPWFHGRVATPTDDEGKPLEPSIPSHFIASDDLHTTASDYARFMLSVMNREGLSAGIATERERVQASTRARSCQGGKGATCPEEMGFGLGWEVLRFKDDTLLWHTGADRGEFCFGYLSLTRRTGTILLTNSQHGYRIVLGVLERLGTEPTFMKFLRDQAGE